MNTLLKTLISCCTLALLAMSSSLGQVVVTKDSRANTFGIGNTNQPPTTASSVQMLAEMLQQLPADLPHCAQNFDTFGIIATGHLAGTQPLSGWNTRNSLAFKRNGQLAFEILETPMEGPPNGSGYRNYRVFVAGGQVCVSRDSTVLARNIQVQKISSTIYSVSWYTSTSVVMVTFRKKKDSIIC